MKTKTAPVGFLQVSQSLVTTTMPPPLPYDLSIAAMSWETRATATIEHLRATSTVVQLLKFNSGSTDAARRKDEQTRKAVAALGESHVLLELASSLNFDENSRRIEAVIRDAYNAKARPIRVLLDASCIPKRYLLFLIALGFRREYVAVIDILYSEGVYDLPLAPVSARVSVPRGLVSEGKWTSVQVPYLEAADYAPSKRDLCIAIGAEISVALPLIERIDPRKIRLIEIAGSASRVPQTHLSHEAKAINTLKALANVSTSTFELFDIIGLAQDILANREISMSCLAIGSKPHAIAFALAALAHDDIEIVCRAPGGYVAADVKPSGRIFRFAIADRFEAQSYFTVSVDAQEKAATVKRTPRKSRARKSKSRRREASH